MATKYDYLSTCCKTDYSETRNLEQPQVYTTCVQCGQGEYTLTTETKLADVPEPVYVAPVEAELENLPVE